jgi:hypothetical protein
LQRVHDVHHNVRNGWHAVVLAHHFLVVSAIKKKKGLNIWQHWLYNFQFDLQVVETFQHGSSSGQGIHGIQREQRHW